MKKSRIIIITLLGLMLIAPGAFSAVFNVSAPGVDRTAEIQGFIDTAMVNGDPSNLIQFQAGTYVMSASLLLAGNAANVTFVSTGALNSTIIVHGNHLGTSNRVSNWDGGIFCCDVTNSNIGWDNLVLLPPSFTTTGVTDDNSQTSVGVSSESSGSDFTMINFVVTNNNNADQPSSLDGSLDPTTLTNYSWFGGTGWLMENSTVTGGGHNNVYLKDCVLTGQEWNLYINGAYTDPTEPGSTGDNFVAVNCVFSWTASSDGMNVDGMANVTLDGCQFHNNNLNSNDGIGAEIVEAKNLIVRNCYFHHNAYGCLTRYALVSLFENNFFEMNDRYGFGERYSPRSADIQYTTTTIRDCTTIGDHLACDDTSGRYSSGIHVNAGYSTIERCTAIGSAFVPPTEANHYGGLNGIFVRNPIKTVIRDCYAANWNRCGIITVDGWASNELPPGANVLIENCVVEDCGNHANPNLAQPIQTDGNYNDIGDGFHGFSPISLDQGQYMVVRDCTINRTFAPALSVALTQDSGEIYKTAEVIIENIKMTDCHDRLLWVQTDEDNSNIITVDGIDASGGNPTTQLATYAYGMDVMGASVTVRNSTVVNRIAGGLRNISSGVGSATWVHSYENLYFENIGADALVVGNSYRGQSLISDVMVDTVTAGNGIVVGGGSGSEISSCFVTNANSWGVTIGDNNIAPQSSMNMASMDDLCLYNNVAGGIRFIYGDNTQPPMTLTNTTILGNPVGISYEHLFGQVLQVTDTIVAGDTPAPAGIGINVPGVVTDTFSGISAPRVEVFTSALAQAGPWALATGSQVAVGNEAGTVVFDGNTVTNDPVFKSTTPGSADFLIVTSGFYQGKATNVGVGQTTDLDGCSTFELDPLAISNWRLY
jgi:Right handed beta helix region